MLAAGAVFGNERLVQHVSRIDGVVGQKLVNSETGLFYVDIDLADIDSHGGGEEAEFTVTGLPPWMQWFGQNVPKDPAKQQSRDASSGYWYPPAGGSYNPVVGIPDRPGDWTIHVTARWPDAVEETVEIPVHVSCWGDYTYDESKDPVVTHFPIIACRVGQPLKNPFTNGDYVDVDLADVDCRSSFHPDTEETITVKGFRRGEFSRQHDAPRALEVAQRSGHPCSRRGVHGTEIRRVERGGV